MDAYSSHPIKLFYYVSASSVICKAFDDNFQAFFSAHRYSLLFEPIFIN